MVARLLLDAQHIGVDALADVYALVVDLKRQSAHHPQAADSPQSSEHEIEAEAPTAPGDQCRDQAPARGQEHGRCGDWQWRHGQDDEPNAAERTGQADERRGRSKQQERIGLASPPICWRHGQALSVALTASGRQCQPRSNQHDSGYGGVRPDPSQQWNAGQHERNADTEQPPGQHQARHYQSHARAA